MGNRLSRETSPYLLLHAHNPVDWFPWGEEARARAAEKDVPIFLSVGYSTCYWCHVMEREEFADAAVAALMNEWFVNVKVDREEHPEVDELYMTASLLMTGQGGWPSSLFLTPHLKPFYAGTYFPPRDRGGMPAFPKVLRAVHEAWSGRRGEVLDMSESVVARVRAALEQRFDSTGEVPTEAAIAAVVKTLKGLYHEGFGGFGRAPKFPSAPSLRLLWEAGRGGDHQARAMVVETLAAMGRGAICDQLGGGFHRYTLDAAWRVPHFEKMLYDNALLGELLALVARDEGSWELARLARRTMEFLLAEMTLPQGGLATALDAETGGEEGAFYTWTQEELAAAVPGEDRDLLDTVFDLGLDPNLPGGRRTLFLTGSLATLVAALGTDVPGLLRRLEPPLGLLRQARAGRPRPALDDKVLADVNGLAIAALARVGVSLDEPRFLEAARRAARFVLEHLVADGTLRHSWRAGRVGGPALLDDYAFLIHGLLALHGAGREPEWLGPAEALAEELESRLAAPEGGYFTAAPSDLLLARTRTIADTATPSGNAMAALDLIELAKVTGREAYLDRARRTVTAFAGQLRTRPQSMATLALAAMRQRQALTVHKNARRR